MRLPEKTTVVPRFRALPSEKILTKWQKYAKEKGISKKKRSRMVWDETIEDYAPRWGAYSIKHNASKAQAIIEVKKGEDPNQDPYEKQGLEKQLETEKQNMKTLKNRAVKLGATSFKDSVPQEQTVDRRSKKIVKTKSNRKTQLNKQKSDTGKVLAAGTRPFYIPSLEEHSLHGQARQEGPPRRDRPEGRQEEDRPHLRVFQTGEEQVFRHIGPGA